MTALSTEDVKAVFADLKAMASANKDLLTDLDGVMGDSDLGLTMNALFSAADAHVRGSDESDVGKLLAQTGMVMAKAAPSTMGTLVATGFMRGGKALQGKSEIGLSEYLDFWRDFVSGIMQRGRSAPGEKTIVDALYPAFEAIEACKREDGNLLEAARRAADAAKLGVEKTKTMVAQHGRAAYFGEKSRDAQDPGATVGSLILKTFSDYLEKSRVASAVSAGRRFARPFAWEAVIDEEVSLVDRPSAAGSVGQVGRAGEIVADTAEKHQNFPRSAFTGHPAIKADG